VTISDTQSSAEDRIPEASDRLPTAPAIPAKAPRLLALDAFRGLTIILMLLVNNIALDTDTPRQLQHAPWNGGVRLADLVFPWFLFAVGTAIPYAAAAFRRQNLPSWRYDLKVLWRTLLLVLLGCLIDSAIAKHPTFDLNVLQIIGLAYLVGALLSELPASRRLLIAGIMLVGYWAALKYLPIPGFGAGILEETNNLIFHMNRAYFSSIHVGKLSFTLWGLPSVVPTAALVLIGSAIGDLLRTTWDKRVKLGVMLLAAMLLVGGGVLWNISLPFNKGLWTPAYILLTAGLGTLLLSVLFLCIDLPGWRAWPYPLLVFGSNAILAYVAPILLKVLVLQVWQMPLDSGQRQPLDQWLLQLACTHFGHLNGGWVYTIGYIVVWWGVLWVLYRQKLFLRV